MNGTVTLSIADYENLIKERDGFKADLDRARDHLLYEFRNTCVYISSPVFKPLWDAAQKAVEVAIRDHDPTHAWVLMGVMKNSFKLLKDTLERKDGFTNPQALFVAINIYSIRNAVIFYEGEVFDKVREEAKKLKKMPWIAKGFEEWEEHQKRYGGTEAKEW